MMKTNTFNEPKIVSKIEKVMKVINSFFIFLASILIFLMVVIIVQEVLRRYLFNNPTTWSLDIARFLLVYIFFLALAPALESGTHVSTDMITSKLSATAQWISKLIAFLLIAIYGVILFWYVLLPTIDVFQDDRLFPVAIALPMKYIYIIAPFGVIQFIFTALVCMIITFYRPNTKY